MVIPICLPILRSFWKAYNKGKGVTDNIEVAVNRGNTYTGFTRGMIDAFLMEDGKPTYAHHDGYVYEDTTTYAVVRNRDPRLFIFLKRPGQKNVLQGEDNTIAAEQVRPIEPVPQVFTRSFDVTYTTGYAIRKRVVRSIRTWQKTRLVILHLSPSVQQRLCSTILKLNICSTII